MPTEKRFMQDVVEALQPLDVSTRPMFGEYCMYLDGKVIGFICDDTVFLKPSGQHVPEFADLEMGPAYEGSKDYFIVPDDMFHDPWFRDAAQATANALPAPNPKKPRKGKDDDDSGIPHDA